jgi:hypothetical protein
LTTLTIPHDVASIGNGAFLDCRKLSGVYFEGDAPSFEGDAVAWCSAVIIYHRAGADGWADVEMGRPTAVWIDPPLYADWLQSTVLPTMYPDSSGEADDADGDGMTNYAEMLAGTDPADWTSRLILNPGPRPDDLPEEDLDPLEEWQTAVYIRSNPGKTYAVQYASNLQGPWYVDAVITATTSQKRFVLPKPPYGFWWDYERPITGFYRVILAQ